MSEAGNPEAGAEQAAGGNGGKKKLILIVLVLLLAGGGAGGYFYFKRGAAAETEGEETAEKTDKKKSKKKAAKGDDEEESASSKKSESLDPPSDEAVKHVVELEPFIVNLADTDASRYLRLNVSVGVGGEEGGEAEKPSPLFVTRVRSALLAVLSTKTSTDILSPNGKAKLRRDLLKAAQAASEEPAVEAIYITDFIVQM